MKILELRRELEDSKAAQSMMKNQLQVTENRLLVTENRVMALECQLHELLGQKHVGGSTLTRLLTAHPFDERAFNILTSFAESLALALSVVRQGVLAERRPENVLVYSGFRHPPEADGEGCAMDPTAPLQGVTSESCLPTEMAYNPLVPMLGCIFSALPDANLGAQPSLL